MLISRIIVFDDDARELVYRRSQVITMVAELRAKGALRVADVPADELVVGVSARHLAQELVLEALAPAPDSSVLVLADMAADHHEFRGNIGGRLVRGLAQRAGVDERTTRVTWTRQAVVGVTDGLAPWVHATAAYRPDNWDDLADAVLHALDAGQPTHRVFPVSRPVEAWKKDVREKVGQLVGEENVLVGDDRIALSVRRGVLDSMVNDDLTSLRFKSPGARRSVHLFLDAVREHLRHENVARSRREVVEVMAPVAEESVASEIDPDLIANARDCLRQTLEGYTAEEQIATTWLTGAELQLAQRFIRRYTELSKDLRANAQGELWRVLLQMRGRPGRAPDPVWEQAMQQLGLDFTTDLAYALWTLKDVHQQL